MRLTTKIKPDLAQALRRAAADRSVYQVQPYTVPGIVMAALEDWLQAEGYWPPG
ncbi:MAG: hypothetical protein ACYSUI_14510 [Planctomycetota bacterium]|jgi:hypothetical protein